MRKKAIARATPVWVDQEEIEKRYAVARLLTELTGVQHHVDHYFPLKGKTASGLHVPWNLRVIPWRDNLMKKNKMPTHNRGVDLDVTA